MDPKPQFLSPAEAASRLGISPKALRLYEERGLLAPLRTAAGWRAYGPDEMQKARKVVDLRALGLTLGEIARVLRGEVTALSRMLERHEAALLERAARLQETIANVRRTRADLECGTQPAPADLRHVVERASSYAVAFDLPWPWGGERFEMEIVSPVNVIVGPLGSGKTRLAREIAAAIPHGIFVGLDRVEREATKIHARLAADPVLSARVDAAVSAIVDDGGVVSDALLVLLAALEAQAQAVPVIDMIEQGLDAATQEAVAAHVRRRGAEAPPLFFLTRSSAILDLDAVGADTAIIYCPANHSPPMRVPPHKGAPGYEAVAMCLASPEVRRRTEGVVAIRRSA